uniref:Zinc finger protein 865 n=1 Tax=Macaca nemestrina TaxID=9545 RepID=A0A2K6D0P0_MACNE
PVPALNASAVPRAARRCSACGKTFRYRSNLLEH